MGLGDQPLRPLTRLRSSLGYFLGRALTHSPVSSEPPSIRGRFTPVVPNPGGAMTPAGLSARLTTLSEHEDTRKSAPVASACHVGTRASHRGRGARDGRAAGALSATAAPGCSAAHDPHAATRGRGYGQACYALDRAICNTECRRRDEGCVRGQVPPASATGGEGLLPGSIRTADLLRRGDFVGDASTSSPWRDQHGGGSQSLHPIDQVQHHGRVSHKDVVMVAPVGHALAVEQQFEPRLDSDRLSDTLSALARRHQVPGAQLAIHHGGETVAVEVGELQYGTGRPVTRDAAVPIGSITKTFTANYPKRT